MVPPIPLDALVLLVGPAGSGKSTYVARRFRPSEILSSDAFRELVCDDPGDQSASGEAFRLLHGVARARLRRGRLTVIDATNLLRSARLPLLRMAAGFGRPVVALVFDGPMDRCLAWNASRPGRSVPEEVVRHHYRLLAQALRQLPEEGYHAVRLVDARATLT